MCPRYLRNQMILPSRHPPSLRSLRRPQSPLTPPPPPPLEEYYQELNRASLMQDTYVSFKSNQNIPICFHQGPSSHQLLEATSPPNSSGYYSSHSPQAHNSSNCSSPPHIYDRPTSPAKSNLSNGSGKPFFKPSAIVPLQIDQPAEKSSA